MPRVPLVLAAWIICGYRVGCDCAGEPTTASRCFTDDDGGTGGASGLGGGGGGSATGGAGVGGGASPGGGVATGGGPGGGAPGGGTGTTLSPDGGTVLQVLALPGDVTTLNAGHV